MSSIDRKPILAEAFIYAGNGTDSRIYMKIWLQGVLGRGDKPPG